MTSPVVSAPGAASAEPHTVRAYFFISAPADPGLLPRLIEPVAKLGAVPARVHASRESGDGCRPGEVPPKTREGSWS